MPEMFPHAANQKLQTNINMCTCMVTHHHVQDDDDHHHQNYDQNHTWPQGPGMKLPTPSVASLAIVHSTGVGSFTGSPSVFHHLLPPVFQHQEGPKAVRPRRNCRSINLLQIATPAPMLQHISRQGKLHLQEKMGSTLSREVLHYRPMMQHDQCNSINLLQIVTAAPMLQHIPRQGKVCMHPFVRT